MLIHAVLLCATTVVWPCHLRPGFPDVEPRIVLAIDATPALVAVDTPITRRPKAIQYSDWYSRRLTVHRIGSYTMLPLFAAEWSLGQNLLQDQNPPSWMRRHAPSHRAHLDRPEHGGNGDDVVLEELNRVDGWTGRLDRCERAGRGSVRTLT